MEYSVYKWIENWIKDCIQKEVINDSYSERSKVISIVPQGLVLKPLLLNLFINEIALGIKSTISVFE